MRQDGQGATLATKPVQIGNSQLIWRLNSRLVLQSVRAMQPTYRAEVARATGLKPATLTSIVTELVRQGMIQEIEVPSDGPRWGRPPMMLRLNADAKRILAIDLEPDRIRVALTNLLVEPIEYHEQRIDRFSAPDATFEQILGLCGQAMRGTGRKRLLGVGVSLPGLLDRDRGVLLGSTNMPKWRDVPVREILRRELKLPVRVERSIHLAALYEQWSDPQRAEGTTLLISLRTGIGFSFLDHGRLYLGQSGFDGELGHTVVDIDGKPCECGSRGCLETFVSAPAIQERARRLLTEGGSEPLWQRTDAGEPLTPELVYRLAKEGDAGCAGIVRDVGRYLGIAVANMINLLAPSEVVIAGSIDVTDELLLGAVREQVNRSALPRSRERVALRLARQQDRLPLLGAAVSVAEQLFALPELQHAAGAARQGGAASGGAEAPPR